MVSVLGIAIAILGMYSVLASWTPRVRVHLRGLPVRGWRLFKLEGVMISWPTLVSASICSWQGLYCCADRLYCGC